MALKERVGNNVDVDWSIFSGILEVKRKRNQVYNNYFVLNFVG